MLKIQRIGDHDHAAIRIDDTSVGLDAITFAAAPIPLQADGNARIHTAAAAVLVKARAQRFNVAGFYRHTRPMEAMLKLGEVTVNGT